MRWLVREASLVTAVVALVLLAEPSWLGLLIRISLLVNALLVSGAILSHGFARFPQELSRRGGEASSNLIRPIGEVHQMRDIEQANDFLIAVDYQLFPFLRKQLREITAHRLLANHNVDLKREVAPARRLLGEELWELVRPVAIPDKGEGWGTISTAQLARITDELEQL
jgi:hypothetical protein